MKQIELKDIEYNKEYITAYKTPNGTWAPVIVYKHIQNNFYPGFITKEGVEMSWINLLVESRGKDIFGFKITYLCVFDSYMKAVEWCEFEKKINNI